MLGVLAKCYGPGIGLCVSLGGATRRRDFVTFVARAAAVWPGIALAQQSAGKVWHVAHLYLSMRGPYKKIDAALGDRMR